MIINGNAAQLQLPEVTPGDKSKKIETDNNVNSTEKINKDTSSLQPVKAGKIPGNISFAGSPDEEAKLNKSNLNIGAGIGAVAGTINYHNKYEMTLFTLKEAKPLLEKTKNSISLVSEAKNMINTAKHLDTQKLGLDKEISGLNKNLKQLKDEMELFKKKYPLDFWKNAEAFKQLEQKSASLSAELAEKSKSLESLTAKSTANMSQLTQKAALVHKVTGSKIPLNNLDEALNASLKLEGQLVKTLAATEETIAKSTTVLKKLGKPGAALNRALVGAAIGTVVFGGGIYLARKLQE